MFFLAVILILNLVVIQYDAGRVVSWWTTLTIISLIYFYDFIFSSSSKQKEIFYIPMFIELALLGTGYLAYINKVPERFCDKNRFVKLYVTGYIFFQLTYLNLVVEAHNIMYDNLKWNSGNYDEDTDNWYRFNNIYNK